MTLGVIGLGTMGSAIARRVSNTHTVYGLDPYADTVDIGNAQRVEDYAQLLETTQTILILVPAGQAVDDVINTLLRHTDKKLTIMDGGNSNFHDSVRRHDTIGQKGHKFLDVGISGGSHGEERGYSVMAGGSDDVYQRVEPILESIAAPNGYAHVGPAGAGHYVKMVHNGIEYALLQAYAEGFHLLREGRYSELDLEQIAHVWQNGAIVDSFILSLIHAIMQQDQQFSDVSGYVAEGGTGRWTVEEAFEQGIPVHTIAESLNIRLDSQKSGGTYATKLIALLRHAFGGHTVREKKTKS